MRKVSPSKLAAKVLKASADDMELLREHDFKDDEAMHDDELHEMLRAQFAGEVDRITQELSETYGKPLRTGATDNKFVGLNGVVRYAVWRIGEKHLYVAAAREERECPFLLVIGAAAGTCKRDVG